MRSNQVVCDICESPSNLVYCKDDYADNPALCDNCLVENNDTKFAIYRDKDDGIKPILMLHIHYNGLRCNIYGIFTLKELIDYEVDIDALSELILEEIDTVSDELDYFKKDFCDYFGIPYCDD